MPASSVANVAGARRLRRRLSSIFQRPIERDRAADVASGARPGPRIQGSSCQSPRTQRCWREAATS